MTKKLVGKTLGQYKLDAVIGEGGMATVYKAHQTSLNRSVALKVLYHQEDTSLVRFEREAKAIASLRHRNILIIYEYGEAAGWPFIAMEYVEGGTLEDRLDQLNGKPMDWRRVVELTIPIAEALHYAHGQGIIHRDVKPSNILMAQEDWPVLADFGLVKYTREQVGLTLKGTFMGTPSYIAPEQARDVKLDFRADMYSLGIIMFEMISGRLPFDYESPNKILLAHVMEPPPSPRHLNPTCPPALEQVILTALEKSADKRYADMQEMVDMLKAILAGGPSDVEAIQTKKLRPSGTVNEEQQGGEVESAEGFLGSVRKLLKGKSDKKEASASGRTTPRPKIEVQGSSPVEDHDSTLQLNVDSSEAGGVPRIILQDRNITIKLPKQDSIIIGRKYRNNVIDVDLERYEASKYGVSRKHARLMRRGESWQLEDLGSLNGTFINDKELKPGQPAILKDGDKVRFSHMDFIFRR